MWSGIKGIPGKLSSGWSSAKSSVGYHTKAIANSTGKWFGKAWQSVKSTTGSIYNQTKQNIQMLQIKLGRIQNLFGEAHQNGLAMHIKVQRAG